jgi:hypothetical protein
LSQLLVPGGFRVVDAGHSGVSRWLLRPILSRDLRALMQAMGPTVDALYPKGASLPEQSLSQAANGYASASVVVRMGDRSNTPVALMCEKPKGRRRVKVSTFWVAPTVRGNGIGKLLAASRFLEWRWTDLEEVYGTVRAVGCPEMLALLSPFGFRHTPYFA